MPPGSPGRRPPSQPRPKPPTEVPLDEGRREGTDAWREVDGVQFCHWDRWLLRLALDEPEGLRAVARELRRRTSSPRGTDHDAEALLAQLSDLEARLDRLGLTPAALLDDVERASKWLHDKAWRRIWHARSLRCTAAMERTPRKVLSARALMGNWPVFPVSPAPYFAELRSVVGDGRYDYRGTGLVVTLLDNTGQRLLLDAKNDDERLAIHRAMLAASIVAMEQVDDSLAELAQHFREYEAAYLALFRAYVEAPGLLRDLLELVVWEDYGLFHQVGLFLSSLPEPQADLALRELARIIAELRGAGLQYQLDSARALRRTVVDAFSGGEAP